MTSDLYLLVWSVVLGMVHLGAAALAKRAQEPPMWSMGARDDGAPHYSGMTARLIRAQSNFMETFPFFASLLLVCHVAGRAGGLALWGAHLFFWARLAFLPLYALGYAYVRTAVWIVSVIGMLLVLINCFVAG